MPTCENCHQFLPSSGAMVEHLEKVHKVHVRLNATSSHVAYCDECHKYIGRNKAGVESRIALEKHLSKKHSINIQG